MQNFGFPIGLLFLTIPLVALGRRLNLPYPIVLVVGGLVLSVLPWTPPYRLEPDVVFYVLLPPLLYWGAGAAPLGEIKKRGPWVASLAISLVAVTTGVVALTVRALQPEISWGVAIMLGAIVAPTDAVAVEAIAKRMRLPRNVGAIIEGESLLNDAVALVLYRAALGAVIAGGFDASKDIASFFISAGGAVGYGVLVGFAATMMYERFRDTDIQTAIAITVPFAAFVPADHAGLSGVLATVAAGFYVNRFSPAVTTFTSRLRLAGVAETGEFLFNATLFLLVGLQLRGLQADAAMRSPETLLFDAVILNIVIFAVRFLWIYGRALVLEFFGRVPDSRNLAIIVWSGMRGSISLAAALAVPFALPGGAQFPDRHFVLTMTFSVIVVTLIGQGLTLPFLIRATGVSEPPASENEVAALRKVGERALEEVARMREDGTHPAPVLDRLQRRYESFNDTFAEEAEAAVESVQFERSLSDATRDVIAQQRAELFALRRAGLLDDAAVRSVQRLLDLQEAELAQMRVVKRRVVEAQTQRVEPGSPA